MTLLTDSQGVKIGKTEGNAIALADKPEDLFGKIMALSDNAIVNGLLYLTDLSKKDVESIEKKMKKGENPMNFKKLLAFEVVRQLNGEKEAEKAQEQWISLFSKKEISSANLPELKLVRGKLPVLYLVIASGAARSKSEARRLIEQKAVSIDDQAKENPSEILSLHGGEVLKIGKKIFFRIKI